MTSFWSSVAAIQKAMLDQKLVIADGHHRYETALAYRNECRSRLRNNDPDAPFERVMMTFINTHSEGLTILPTHRVASHIHEFSWPAARRHLEPWFTAEGFPCLPRRSACAPRPRRLSRRLAEVRFLRSDASRWRQSCATPAQRFAAPA